MPIDRLSIGSLLNSGMHHLNTGTYYLIADLTTLPGTSTSALYLGRCIASVSKHSRIGGWGWFVRV